MKKNIRKLFQNLDLLTAKGELTRAAILLFGKKPQRFFRCADFKIGRFRGVDSTDLIVHDLLEGNLINMVERAMDLLRSKYLWSPISYNDLTRVETLEIPDKALRETILNAIIHKDYNCNSSISIRVYETKIVVWNSGEIDPLQIDDLKKDHDSYKRNPLIANVFYRAGFIEAWGRGTNTIVAECVKSNMEEPVFGIRQGGLEVIFKRHPMRLSENGVDTPIHYTLSKRQKKAIDYVREKGQISNKIYQELNGVSKRTATNDLQKLVEYSLLVKEGSSGESVKYQLVGQ